MKKILIILIAIQTVFSYAQESRMVTSLEPGAGDGIHEEADVIGTVENSILFLNRDNIWISDGSASGTKVIDSLGNSGYISLRTVVLNEKLYYIRKNEESAFSIIEVDPSTATINSLISGYESISNLLEFNGKIYCEVEPASFESYFASIDPTSGEVVKIFDLNSFGGLRDAVVHDNMIYSIHWSADESGAYLSKSDGTPGNVDEFLFLHDGSDFSKASRINMTSTEGNLFFFYYSENSAYGFYTSDGTAEETQLLNEEMEPSTFYDYNGKRGIGVINDKILFRAESKEDSYYKDLWISDGTIEGTQMIRIIDEETSVRPEYFTNYNDKLYFYGQNRNIWTDLSGLLVSDGTPEGTAAAYDEYTHPEEFYYTGNNLAKHDGKLIFSARNENQDVELYSSEGDLESIKRLSEIAPGGNFSDIYGIYPAGDNVFFIGDTGPEGRELYVYGPELSKTVDLPFSHITLYPNPTSDYVNMNAIDGDIEEIRVLTMEGKTVLELKGKQITESLDLRSLNSGKYLVKILSSKGKYLSKVIKL